jgi:hypothetical protein
MGQPRIELFRLVLYDFVWRQLHMVFLRENYFNLFIGEKVFL